MKKADKEISEMMSSEHKDSKNCMVRFKKDVGEFLDSEGNERGPFSKDEIANLPKGIVEILKQDENVEVIEE